MSATPTKLKSIDGLLRKNICRPPTIGTVVISGFIIKRIIPCSYKIKFINILTIILVTTGNYSFFFFNLTVLCGIHLGFLAQNIGKSYFFNLLWTEKKKKNLKKK